MACLFAPIDLAQSVLYHAPMISEMLSGMLSTISV